MNNKILIVDDDEELCAELTEILEAEGFQVQSTLNGILGRMMMKAGRYQVVVLDLKLSGMSGFEILKKIRDNRERQKVLVFSGKPFGSDTLSLGSGGLDGEKEAQAVGQMADAVLSKPVEAEKLLRTIKQLMAMPETACVREQEEIKKGE